MMGITTKYSKDNLKTECNVLLSSEENPACPGEYATAACTNSLQALTAEAISTWAFPRECSMADGECLASNEFLGKALFQAHKAEVCMWCIKSAYEQGCPQDQSCIDQVTECCGGMGPGY
jgi:hypothetical protein